MPVRSMLRSLKVATPASVGTVVVPERVPPPGFFAIVTLTLPAKLSTAFPSESRATTGIGGAIIAPAIGHGASTGPGMRWGVNVSWIGAPGLMVKEALVVPARPAAVADSRYALPAWSISRVEKVATPATAVTVVVPERVAPLVPVPAVIVSVTSPAKFVAV